MNKLITAAALAAGVVLGAGTASASLLLDFTKSPSPALTGTFAGTGYTVEIFPLSSVPSFVPGAGPTCDSLTPLECTNDGIGIAAPPPAFPDDEISPGNERLVITFDDPVKLAGFWLLDLFRSNEDPDDIFESAEYRLGDVGPSGSGWLSVDAEETFGGTSGVVFVDLQGAEWSKISFRSPVKAFGGDDLGVNDFAVAGIAAVPLPAGVLLLGLGLGGLAVYRRRQAA